MGAQMHNFCNEVIPFTWDRLKLGDYSKIDGRQPCLEEDWFVEDALAAGSPFVWRDSGPDMSHRLLYRYARARNVEQCCPMRNPHWLLLHQMTQLVPALFVMASAASSTGEAV